MMTMLPLLLWTANVRSDDQFRQDENQFNLTTISPDDETIDSLIEAVDSAVDSLQNAIGGTTDSSYNYYDLDDYNDQDEDSSEDYFNGDDDYDDDEDIDLYVYEDEEEPETNTSGDYPIDEDGAVVVEESQLTESTYNRTVRFKYEITAQFDKICDPVFFI